jgi:hypothetical protein
MAASFAIQPILNKSEARVFREFDRFVISCNPGWQVMAQVSLGEILRCKDAEAYSCINSKRAEHVTPNDYFQTNTEFSFPPCQDTMRKPG